MVHEGKEFEELMGEALPPEPGEIGDPDLGVEGDFPDPPLNDEEDEPTEVNEEDDEVDDEAFT